MQTTPQQQAVLDQYGKGWRLISIVPPTDPLKTYPPGSEQWNVVNAEGKPAPMIVQPPTAVGTSVPWPVGADGNPTVPPDAVNQTQYTVVQSPEGLVPTPTAASQAEVTWTQQFTSTSGGVTTRYGTNSKTGKVEMIPGAPTETAAAKATPTPADQYVPFKGPDGTVLAMVDPKDPTNRIPVPANTAGADKLADGTPKQTIDNGRVVNWVAKSGQWQIASIGAPEPKAPTAVSGNTTDPFLETQNADGTINRRENPNYKKPTPGAPTTLSAPANQEFIVQQDPTSGQTTNLGNPNYQPADVASKVRQLQARATAERDRINALAIPNEEKIAQFNQWYDTTIEPEAQQLKQAQSTTQAAAQRTAQQDQTANITAESTYERNRQSDARQIGMDASKNVMDTLPYRVGPQFGEHFSQALNTLSSGGGATNFGAADFTYDMPDPAAIAEQATAKALAHISPYAAMKANQPMPQIPPGVDLNSALSASRYQPGGGAPPPGAPTTTIAPDGTVTVAHAPTPAAPPPPPPGMNDWIRGARGF